MMKELDDELIAQGHACALEAGEFSFGKLTSNVIGNFQAFLGNAKDYMADVAGELKRGSTQGFAPSPMLDRRMSKASYSNLAEVDIYIPVGLVANYLTYLDALNDSMVIVEQLMDKTLEPAVSFLSLMVASPENLTSISAGAKFSDIHLFIKEREAAKASVAKCFGKNDNRNSRRFGDYFDRMADWKTAGQRLGNLSERLSACPAKSVSDKVSQLCEIMDRLLICMKNKPEVYEISGMNAKVIADLTLNLGQLVEFYAAFVYLIQVVNHAMEDTVKKLDGIVA